MKRNSKGFYTLEAVIFLPLVLLAVLSLGYFMKVEGAPGKMLFMERWMKARKLVARRMTVCQVCR